MLCQRWYWNDDREPKKNTSALQLQNLLSKIEERRKNKQVITFVNELKPVSSTEAKKRTGDLPNDDRPCKLLKSDVVSGNSTDIQSDTNTVDNFTIIKNLDFKKTQKIKRVLPFWLANPVVIPVDLKHLSVSVSDVYYLDSSLINLLQKNKITHFFPVQAQLIPWLLCFHRKCKKFWPRDVCVSAPTGSGKTLAFVLPIVQILKKRMVCCVRALVVLPTKDLAFQVFKVFKQYLVGTNLKAICLGNAALEKEMNKILTEDEIIGYRSLVDIIITTPGRLVEHLKYTKGFSLSNLKFLVIDEADHVMDSVQNDWLRHLQRRIPPFIENSGTPYLTLSKITEKPARPQKLLFSATLSQDPEKLKQLNLFQPFLFTSVVKSCENDIKNDEQKNAGEFIGKFTTPAELKEYYTVCPISTKPLVLYYLIKQNKWKRVLCFADSVSSVHKLASLLKQLNSLDEEIESWNIVEISSKLCNTAHRKILDDFSKNIDVLVTTDTLARGIDLQNVGCVALYDAPKFVKNYIHRVGRTGRAGQTGISLVLLTPEQKDHFNSILHVAGKTNVNEITVTVSDLRKLETIYKNSLEAVRVNLQAEKIEKKNTKFMKHGSAGRRKRKRKPTEQLDC